MRVEVVAGRGEKLSSSTKRFIMSLLKVNMEQAFGDDWPFEEKVKRRDMVSPEARYLFLQHNLSDNAAHFVGFLHYRFTLEEDIPVLYVYELQLQSDFHGKGLGSFLMQLAELMARENGMAAIVLTVQKKNVAAVQFYTDKHKYIISSISPSRVDPAMEAKYEILCKVLDHQAQILVD